MTITLTREEAQSVLDALVFATPSGYGPTEVYKNSIVLLQNRLAKETPYEVGQRLYRQGLGISDIPTAVYSDSDIAEAYRGFEDARLAQPEPEPVAWLHSFTGYGWQVVPEKLYPTDQPLYTAPPQREWRGLTEAERLDILDAELTTQTTEHFALAQAIEAKLKEKNT